MVFHKLSSLKVSHSHVKLQTRSTVYSEGQKCPYYFQEGIYAHKIYSPKIFKFMVWWAHCNGKRYGYTVYVEYFTNLIFELFKFKGCIYNSLMGKKHFYCCIISTS